MVQDFAGLSEGCQRMRAGKFLWVAKGRQEARGLDPGCGRGKEKPYLLRQRPEALGTKDEVFNQMVPGFFSALPPGN